MQSATAPEDLHSILSRFSSWAGKHPTRPSKEIGEGVREIPYEEALRQLRDRRAASHYGTAAVLATEDRRPDPAPAQNTPPAQETAAPVVPQTPKAPAPKRPPAAAAKPAPKPAKPADRRPPSRKKPAAAATESRPAFRQMLAKSISAPKQPAQKPTGQGQKPAGQDRELRLSFRVSRDEEQELHRRADRAGVTISAYLRHCALGPQSQEQPPLRTEAAPRHQPALPSNPDLLADEAPAAGSWLSRIRQKFLAPPDWNESA